MLILIDFLFGFFDFRLHTFSLIGSSSRWEEISDWASKTASLANRLLSRNGRGRCWMMSFAFLSSSKRLNAYRFAEPKTRINSSNEQSCDASWEPIFIPLSSPYVWILKNIYSLYLLPFLLTWGRGRGFFIIRQEAMEKMENNHLSTSNNKRYLHDFIA